MTWLRVEQWTKPSLSKSTGTYESVDSAQETAGAIWKSGSLKLPPNAAVERRRDHVCSAPHVHNEMAHLRRARADV
jgi:hypothetical protein